MVWTTILAHALLALKGGTAASVSVFFFTREGSERFFSFFKVILIHDRFCRFCDCLAS